jgi:hypothetical protein
MARRWLVLGIALLALGVWARPPLPAAATLLAKSDAAYDFPCWHGVTGVAASVRVEQANADPALAQARIRYAYTSANTHGFVVEGLPPDKVALRDGLLAAMAPLDEYIMPRPGAASFAGADLSVRRVARQIQGIKQNTFHQVIATRRADGQPTHETRVVLDAFGLARTVEEWVDGALLAFGAIEHEPSGTRWRVTRVSTLLRGGGATTYYELRIAYVEVDGAPFPTRIDVTTRDRHGRPLAGAPPFAVLFSNYQVTKAAGA